MLAASAGSAQADAELNVMPQPVAVHVKHLGWALDLYAAQVFRTKLAASLTGLTVGAVMVPSGLVLLGRADGVSRALVIGMVIGGSAQLLSVPAMWIPTRMDGLREAFLNRARDSDSEDSVKAFENEWRLAAEASRRKRAYLGTTLALLGASGLATGLTFLLAPEGVLGMSRKTQYTWGGVLMGVGIPLGTYGVRFVFEWSPEEVAWHAYHSMVFDSGYWGRRQGPPLSLSARGSFGAIPTPGGALLFASLSY